jgi:hypothetical protein
MVEQVISSIAALAAVRLRRWVSDKPSGSATRSSVAITPAERSGDELADARQQLARGEFGEGDGGDGARRNAFSEHGGDAPSHDGGLARTRARLDQDGAIMKADRMTARAVVLQHFGHVAHHSASQT